MEYAKLSIKNANIKIKTNINFPIFLKTIYNYTDNIFICDFVNKDYFWLDKTTDDSSFYENNEKELLKN